MPLWRGGPNTRTLPTVLLTPSPSKAADMAHLCVPQNQALGVCRGFVPDIQVCGTHGREDLVNATIKSNAEEEEELPSQCGRPGQLLTTLITATTLTQPYRSPNLSRSFVACLTPQQHASVSQGRICSDNFTCYHTETEVADQTFHLTQSQYTDTGPTSPALTLYITQAPGSHWSAHF